MGTIGEININFDTFSNSPYYLAVMDLSDWVYAEDLTSYIQITLPGSKKPKNFTFIKEKTSIYNSHNLGLSCLSGGCEDEEYVELPDGIYTVTVKSGYQDIECTKYYLKTDLLELDYNKVLIEKGTEVSESFINYMAKIKYTLDVAKSHTMLGDFIESNRYYNEAKDLLKRVVECKDCI